MRDHPDSLSTQGGEVSLEGALWGRVTSMTEVRAPRQAMSALDLGTCETISQRKTLASAAKD